MAHTPRKDTSIDVLLPYYANPEGHDPHTIELDCPPGYARPWHLIHSVIEGTGLTLSRPETDDDHSGAFFGAASFAFPNTTCDEWIAAQAIVKERITDLYNSGRIRYGSW